MGPSTVSEKLGVWKILQVLALGLGLFFISACRPAALSNTPTPLATAAITQTQVIEYTPSLPTGQEQAGRCWTGSIAAVREGAWRCMVGNQIYDPCFAVGQDATIVCDADPATNKPGFTIKLTEPLPAVNIPPQAKENYQGWLIELADGAVCNFATGATTGVNGERVNYLCSDGWGILGNLHPGKVWTANKVIVQVGANGPSLVQSETAPVRTVWQ